MAKKPAIRMNISVPADLKRRMDKVKENVNWSAIATNAFRQWLDIPVEHIPDGRARQSARNFVVAACELFSESAMDAAEKLINGNAGMETGIGPHRLSKSK